MCSVTLFGKATCSRPELWRKREDTWKQGRQPSAEEEQTHLGCGEEMPQDSGARQTPVDREEGDRPGPDSQGWHGATTNTWLDEGQSLPGLLPLPSREQLLHVCHPVLKFFLGYLLYVWKTQNCNPESYHGQQSQCTLAQATVPPRLIPSCGWASLVSQFLLPLALCTCCSPWGCTVPSF